MSFLTKNNAIVGEGCTLLSYSDKTAYTIVKISKNACHLQRDKATPDRNPVFKSGGFGAICINNNEIRYSYEPDTKASIIKAYANKMGEFNYKNQPIIMGRHEFYDHNF